MKKPDHLVKKNKYAMLRRRFAAFRANSVGWWSSWIFLALFLITLPAEFLANDRPLWIKVADQSYFPVFFDYQETDFGGFLPLNADYHDQDFMAMLYEQEAETLWPLVRYSYDTIVDDVAVSPAPPSLAHPFGVDVRSRDVFANIIYGLRISILFGLLLSGLTTTSGVICGAIQGYFGGWTDLIIERVIEIWSAIPMLFVLILLGSLFKPSFFTLAILFFIFGWFAGAGVVRAEFYRARNFDYVKAARALGFSHWRIMFKHVLPNALVATMTFLPFTLAGSVSVLTSLDYLGFGLPPDYPSLGNMALQARNNLDAPWIALSLFGALGGLLMLMIFIGEAIRDAFDPRKMYTNSEGLSA